MIKFIRKMAHYFCSRVLVLSLSMLLLLPIRVIADDDPLDIFEQFSTEKNLEEIDDKDKSALELIAEANSYFQQERPLDARTKLLKAIRKDPKNHLSYTLLAGYYMVHVGHYRLALKYIKQAEHLFLEENGPPPYPKSPKRQAQHAHLLYLISQIRLNLDDYPGALETMDEFTRYGYTAEWYPGSRAWVLMKLGQLDEATRVARLGVLADPEGGGRDLNMLGILLSMQHDRASSIDVFRQSIAYEMAQGDFGSPATPLNNIGEVYRETFQEEKAEAAFLRATSLKDGCEHVLPSLNAAILYLDQLNFGAASQVLTDFEHCVAQYPLRNGEEHRALVHLARGRIDLMRGSLDEALEHFEAARDRRQWFGKIGTSELDLKTALLISYAATLRAKANEVAFTPTDSVKDWLAAQANRLTLSLRARWYAREARRLLGAELNNFEDLYVRNTDSLIEYPTLGDLLQSFPEALVNARLSKEQSADDRPGAAAYYNAWRAQAAFAEGDVTHGNELMEAALLAARPEQDALLVLHLSVLKLSRLMKSTGPTGSAYQTLAEQIFVKNRAALRNAGLPLPISVEGSSEKVEAALTAVGFPISKSKARFSVRIATSPDGSVTLTFSGQAKTTLSFQAHGATPNEAARALVTAVCVEALPTK